MRWGWLAHGYPARFAHWLLPTRLAPYVPLPLLRALGAVYFACGNADHDFFGFATLGEALLGIKSWCNFTAS